jgi:hypothetical protein
MMKSRRSALMIGLLLTLVACTEAVVEPTAPPGVFAPTPRIEGESAPTTGPRPQPTTTMNVDRAAIARVDPYTLELLPFLAPIPMGDSVSGQSSPSGTYFAATAWDDTSGAAEIHLIDVESWGERGSWREAIESELTVDDTGTVYFINLGQLRRLSPGMSESQPVADLPDEFYPWENRLGGGRYLAFGARFEPSVGLEVASVVVAEIETGEVTNIDLPGIRIGNLEPANSEPWSGYLYASPAFVFDVSGTRGLVVHADRDVVTEVDLPTGRLIDHRFSPEGPNGPIDPTRMLLQRSAALSPSGTRLLVATRQLQLDATEEPWTVTITPLGLMTIDTTTWEISSRLDEPIGEVDLSPDGETALAWGWTSTEGDQRYDMTSHGLYVLNGEPLQVLVHHPPGESDQWIGSLSFNQDAGVGYVTNWGQGPGNWVDVIELGSGQILASSTGDDYRQMFGSIGVMGVETP